MKTATVELSRGINLAGEECSHCASVWYRRDIKRGFIVAEEKADTLTPSYLQWLKDNGFTHYKLVSYKDRTESDKSRHIYAKTNQKSIPLKG